jgi:hypothetical protein
MPIQTGKFSNFVDGQAKMVEIAMANLDKAAVYPQYVQVGSTSKITERETDVENMNTLQRWPENTAMPEMEFHEGFPKAMSQEQWGGIIEITKPMWKFQQKNLVGRLSDHLVNAAYKSKEIIATAYLEYGDVAAASVPTVQGIPLIDNLGGDGQELFDTAHGWKSTGSYTYPNKSASLDDLTETAIFTVWSRLARWTDNTGQPLNVQPTGVIVPPELARKAEIVLMSKLDPTTGNNAVNTAAKFLGSKKVIVNPWLSDTTDWYVTTNAKEGKIKMLFAWQNDVKRGWDGNPRKQCYYISLDYSVAHGANRLLSLYKVTA